jgi:diaminohydroxyphosphoribosylaminopyrimidine deaminase/5-amino-6-(5-phosphoribosylamino)uracil reductase
VTDFMPSALQLARSVLYITSPNPRVGCVLVNAQRQIIGQGATQRAGGPHAEIMALQDAASRGFDARGATAYVTLEPCSHHGRTGPCCDALIAAGIRKVVASMADPNPQVSGQGFARLQAAGVRVEVGPGADEARELNLGFFSRMVRQTPWVRMKVAASLDGYSALPSGESQWITSPEARADGHAWRARACAILTGIGTILADNPRLDVREVSTPRQPRLIVVDSQLQTPPDALIFTIPREVLLYTVTPDPDRQRVLEAQGATVITMPAVHGKVDLSGMLHDLARRGVNELHVEAGHKLNGSLMREGLVDEWLAYLAPKLLGNGQPMAAIPTVASLASAVALRFHKVDHVGPDLRILARIGTRDQF